MNDFEDFEWNGIGKRDPISDYITIGEYAHVLYVAREVAYAWSMLAFGRRTITLQEQFEAFVLREIGSRNLPGFRELSASIAELERARAAQECDCGKPSTVHRCESCFDEEIDEAYNDGHYDGFNEE